MKTRVFGPLGMKATTFDFKRALASNHAAAHAPSIDDQPALATMGVNLSVVPMRPAGGAWSNVRDVLKYVAHGAGRGHVAGRQALHFRVGAARAPRAAGLDRQGLDLRHGARVDTTYDIPIVRHGGSMVGYKSDMIWLPDHGVGAVILTNSDSGRFLTDPFRRKLLEILFDGRPEADDEIVARARSMHERIAAERKLLTVPPDPAAAAQLAARYSSPALGGIQVSRAGDTTTFDFGEWKSPVASRKNPDGTTSFITIATGIDGLEFVVGEAAGKRSLVFRAAQNQYAFNES